MSVCLSASTYVYQTHDHAKTVIVASLPALAHPLLCIGVLVHIRVQERIRSEERAALCRLRTLRSRVAPLCKGSCNWFSLLLLLLLLLLLKLDIRSISHSRNLSRSDNW